MGYNYQNPKEQRPNQQQGGYNYQQPNYGGYQQQQQPYQQHSYAPAWSVEDKVAEAMKRVYLLMCLALVVSGFTAYFCAGSAAFIHALVSSSALMWGLIIGEFALVIAISAGINKMSTGVAMLLFFVFSIVNGMMLSSIFLVYSMSSIVKTFFITAGTFGAMSIYGFTTRTDLSKFGNLLFMALIGLIIASVVNIFLHSDTFSWIISIFGVLIFVGLTAWDTQAIKKMAAVIPADHMGKIATLGALTLYLDFINLFLYLLRFFGNSRN